MKYYSLPVLILISIISCDANKQKVYNYPYLENKKETVTHFGIDYTNYFSNLENFKDQQLEWWFEEQDSLTSSYFSDNRLSEYELKLEKSYNRDSPGYYWYRNSRENYFYWHDNDSTQALFRGSHETTEDTLIFEAEYHKTVHFYGPNPEGTRYILFISEEEGDYLRINDIESGNILFETDKDMNMNQMSYAIWADTEHVIFTGWPNKDNSKDSYLAIANINTGEITKIFSGEDVDDYNPEHFIRPHLTYGSNILQGVLINASESYNAYTTNLKHVTNNPVWEPLYKQNDSILYYTTEKDGSLYFLRYKKGKKVFARSILEEVTDPFKDEILFEAQDNTEITQFALSKSNVYVATSENGVDAKVYSIEDKGVNIVDLEYPISDIEFYDYDQALEVTTLLESSWKSNYKFIDIQDDGNTVSVNKTASRNTPEEFKTFQTEIVNVASHDGTMVPMTIIKASDFKGAGDNKGVITAYGAYGYPADPIYSREILDFVSQGNIYAIAHIRGGGEKGLKWYEAGVKENKPNTWKDLMACSRYLKESGYVARNRLGLYVASAGGICMMAVNEEPEMYKALVGVSASLNPLRLGYNEDYNSSDNDYDFGNIMTKEGLKALLALDPVTNIKRDKEYPSVLLMVGSNDELVPMYESAKYIANLQSITPIGTNPYLLEVFKGESHFLPTQDTNLRTMLFFNTEL